MDVIFPASFILLGLLLLLLAIPIDLAFRLERIKQIQGQVNIRWLFGLVRFHIDIPMIAVTKRPETIREPTPVKKATKSKQRRRTSQLFAIVKQAAFRRRLLRFIKDLLRATHSRKLAFFLRIGLDDPADTGLLWGLFGPLGAIVANIRNVRIRIEPEFLNPVFEFRGLGNFRLIPLQLITLVITFLVSPASLRVWRSLR